MSTYSFVSKLRRGASVYAALSLLSGILVALQLVLPSIAFASSSVSGFNFGTSQALDRASVSVVRLVVTYAGVPSSPGCKSSALTGLGVLVGSWPSSPGSKTFNNWVLTDGALVDPAGLSCLIGKPPVGHLANIQMFASSAYTNAATPLSLASVSCPPGKPCNEIICQVSPGCSGGVALVLFSASVPQPFLDIASASQGTPIGIELTGPAALPPDPNQASQFLAPTQAPSLAGNNIEPGMPIIDSPGQLVDMKTKAGDTPGAITQFVTGKLAPLSAKNTNALHDAWNQGVTEYYAGNRVGARTDLQHARTLNTQFQAPDAFLTLMASPAGTPTGTGHKPSNAGGAPSSAGQSTDLFGLSIPNAQLFWLVLVGVLLLVILLALLSYMLLRRQARHRHELARFEEEQRMADQKAGMDAARIAKQEETERQQARQQQAVPVTNTVASPRLLPISDLHCPNCGYPVKASDNYCTNCRAVLSPTESGLHRRATLAPASPPIPMPSSPVPGVVPAASIYDQPTREMSPSQFKDGLDEEEKTLPIAAEELKTIPSRSIKQFTGRNMSLTVGTRSNPGIKRQHKPNEDSLFAAQGERTYNSQPQQFGLFVVADGMGGHASGQDASRLAIQTIVDRIMPELSENEQFTDDALVQLLVDGVKEANRSVHQRNVEHRADMGTTMTAALVVGVMAYVANVGDSRTYLYRKPGGLKKITNDHSVVASLVEAGIIKPDDIYTHPKRNQIYRSLGEKPAIDVDSFKVPLQAGDKLLLCSDGLWDMVRDPTIEQVLSTVPDPSQTGNALIKAALDGGGEDNVSVIVVHINESTSRTGMTGIQLLAKPDAPQYPPM